MSPTGEARHTPDHGGFWLSPTIGRMTPAVASARSKHQRAPRAFAAAAGRGQLQKSSTAQSRWVTQSLWMTLSQCVTLSHWVTKR